VISSSRHHADLGPPDARFFAAYDPAVAKEADEACFGDDAGNSLASSSSPICAEVVDAGAPASFLRSELRQPTSMTEHWTAGRRRWLRLVS